jgi:hypothetical protein
MPSALSIVKRFYPQVKHVKDATEDFEVEVTARDNSTAAVKNHKKCAMAVACERRRGIDGAVISIHNAYLVKGDEATRLMVPESVSREVVSFDRKGGFATGTYALKKPDKWHRLGYRHTSKRDRQTDTRKRSRTAQHITADIRTNLRNKEEY